MLNSTFLANKIKRQIKQNGEVYTFYKYSEDEYHQRKDEYDKEIRIEGIFHETVSNVKSFSETSGARVIKVSKAFILCLLEDGEDISLDDECFINGNKYRVIDKANVGNLNVAYDIIMELIKDEGVFR